MSVSTRPLSEELKEETAQAHQQAEHSSFMTDLLAGDLELESLIAMQQQMLHVYTSLERAVEQLGEDPRVQAIADPLLRRSHRLAADLIELGAAVDAGPLPATVRYLMAIHKAVAENDVASIIAHHYVRYLGDLAGGQIIARKMNRLYGVPPEALSFYDFSALGKIKPYRDRYRSALDQLHLSEKERCTMLDAAAQAFHFNMGVFAELENHTVD